ncbi:hypothetical protein NPIL_593341 [Nephila pilipes]|uniref:Uncharacterized protein n=1 Tax=Nephila pilipes TaxID=299642 RepID=A0A8X6MU80_NEPPI|nr:hypothetical protein NPIL_593341 [Nephila pilipes]
MKSRGYYSLSSAEGKVIQEVQQVDPQWHPKEPRPFVVFAEWRLPIEEDPHFKDYYYRFHFYIQTRADLILDAFPMYFNESILHRAVVRAVRQVPCCGCVDPRPTPSTPGRIFILFALCDTLTERPTMASLCRGVR